MKLVNIVIAALAVATVSTGCGSGGGSESDSPKTFDVTGTFTINGVDRIVPGDEATGCFGIEGYDDITSGTQVVVKDAAGKQIALGQLGLGTPSGQSGGLAAHCELPIEVKDVPIQKDSKIYSIEVSHRGESSFSQDDADGLALTLGD